MKRFNAKMYAIFARNRRTLTKGCDDMTETIFKRKSKVHKKGEYYFLLKRCMDISAALFGGLIMMLPMLLIALLIRMDSDGPVI